MGGGHLREVVAHGGLQLQGNYRCIYRQSNDSVNSWFNVYFYLSLHLENNVHVGGGSSHKLRIKALACSLVAVKSEIKLKKQKSDA